MIAKEGFPLILPSFVLVVILVLLGITIPLFLALLVFLFILYFFRDPKRRVPDIVNAFIAPGDGKVMEANKKRISIFLSIYDVHVNRIPYGGTIKSIEFRRGEYSKAFASKAEKKNEAILTKVESDVGIYTISQMAGIIARRIVNNLEIGSRVLTGERMGMIRFGSRVSTTLPRGFHPIVKIGDSVKAGETVIARKIT